MRSLKKITFFKSLTSDQNNLLDAGEHLLIQHGYDEFELCDLKKEAGAESLFISQAYCCKQDLLLNLLQRYFFEINQELAELYLREDLSASELSRVLIDFFRRRSLMLDLIANYSRELEKGSSTENFQLYIMEKVRFCCLIDRCCQRLNKISEHGKRTEGTGCALLEGVLGSFRATHFTKQQADAICRADPDFVIPDYDICLVHTVKMWIM